MPEQGRQGTNWTDNDNDLIVAEYFAMRALERAHLKFVKADRKRALDETLRRGIGSIDFKLGNISALVGELGLRPLSGFAAAHNYQLGTIGAIERYLRAHPEIMQELDAPPTPFAQSQVHESPQQGVAEPRIEFDEVPEIRVDEFPPSSVQLPPAQAAARRRLIGKFDPIARDERNRALGKAGEEAVLKLERHRLIEADRADLAKKIRWTSQEDGDGAGYDIQSYAPSGDLRLIEVKTTRGIATTPFFISRNEREVSMERADVFHLYRVYDFGPDTRLFTLRPPLEAMVSMEPQVWLASFAQ